MSDPDISVIVPNFNGAYLFPRLFSSLESEFMASAAAIELVLVDDGSMDGSLAEASRLVPNARIIELPANQGFAAAVNVGVRAAMGRSVFLMNTDVELVPGVFDRLFSTLYARSNRFAVSPRITSSDGVIYSPHAVHAEWCDGFLRLAKHPRPEALGRPVATFLVSAGSGLFDRARLLELGGLNEMLLPFYSEDVDLGWRAWSRGWSSWFDGEAIAIHHRDGVINRYFSRDAVDVIKVRNRILVGWLLATRGELLRRHLLPAPRMLLPRYGTGTVIRGFFGALRLLPAVLASRRSAPRQVCLSSITDVILADWEAAGC